jgi:sRNA-binding regulator protein Hfq
MRRTHAQQWRWHSNGVNPLDWIDHAARASGRRSVEKGMRRNLLRSLSLDVIMNKRMATAPAMARLSSTASSQEDHGSNRQAELFYLQKQIQLQTQMVIILEDGARVQGVIEWYDRNSIKVRGKARVLVYKSAIKYLYKAGEIGSAPEE